MKKQPKTLRLSKESIRELSEVQLRVPAGGSGTNTLQCPVSHYVTHCANCEYSLACEM